MGQRICAIPECGRPVSARGLCQTHYRQVRTDGESKSIRPYRKRRSGTRKLQGLSISTECADAIESRAAEFEEARAPQHEAVDAPSRQHTHARHEARDEQHDREAVRHEPVAPTMSQAPAAPTFQPMAAPVAFREVSQHDEDGAESESHRPQRKRRHGAEHGEQQQALQLVETQANAPAQMPAEEDDLPRRTKPRRRRAQATIEEPLKLVETQPGTQPQDGAPTP